MSIYTPTKQFPTNKKSSATSSGPPPIDPLIIKKIQAVNDEKKWNSNKNDTVGMYVITSSSQLGEFLSAANPGINFNDNAAVNKAMELFVSDFKSMLEENGRLKSEISSLKSNPRVDLSDDEEFMSILKNVNVDNTDAYGVIDWLKSHIERINASNKKLFDDLNESKINIKRCQEMHDLIRRYEEKVTIDSQKIEELERKLSKVNVIINSPAPQNSITENRPSICSHDGFSDRILKLDFKEKKTKEQNRKCTYQGRINIPEENYRHIPVISDSKHQIPTTQSCSTRDYHKKT